MSGRSAFEAHLVRRVHPGLGLDVAIDLGDECGVLFGPSGAGKTTVLRLIAGLDRPDAGRVRLGDTVLFDAGRRVDVPLRSRRIGLVFQDDLLFPHLSVAANIRFGLAGRPRREAEARLAEAAALCGVAHLLGRRPSTLSGGERQRVGLARALAPRPRLLLCDEPVSALDLDARFALVDRLRRVRRAEGVPVLYVTHSPAEAIALGSRLFLLRGGSIVARGEPLEVLGAAAGPLAGVDNVVEGLVEGHAPDRGETRVRLAGGPTLVIPLVGRPPGSPLAVGVRSEDIILARGPIAGLSARNVLAGSVRQLAPRGASAEVIVRTGAVAWVVGVVGSAVAELALAPGAEVSMIIKARSCRPLIDPIAPGTGPG